MADWNTPTLSTAYSTLLTALKDRDLDAAKMFKDAPTNPVQYMIRWNRATFKFQEYDGATWQDMDLETGLGLGTMAFQDSNAVSITGGTIGTAVDIDASRLTSGTIPTARFPASLLAQFPIGGGCLWFTLAAPTGYLLCDGSAVSRATYSDLFSVIGTTYGAGNGVTTFNLPDLRQRFPLGKAAAGTGSALAGTGGAIDHTHTYTQVPNHTHPINITDPGHTHNVLDGWDPTSGDHYVSGFAAGQETPVVTSSATTGITATSSNPGGGVATGTTAAQNPPYQVVNYIIRYA